jgi:hypothetical protein
MAPWPRIAYVSPQTLDPRLPRDASSRRIVIEMDVPHTLRTAPGRSHAGDSGSPGEAVAAVAPYRYPNREDRRVERRPAHWNDVVVTEPKPPPERVCGIPRHWGKGMSALPVRVREGRSYSPARCCARHRTRACRSDRETRNAGNVTTEETYALAGYRKNPSPACSKVSKCGGARTMGASSSSAAAKWRHRPSRNGDRDCGAYPFHRHGVISEFCIGPTRREEFRNGVRRSARDRADARSSAASSFRGTFGPVRVADSTAAQESLLRQWDQLCATCSGDVRNHRMSSRSAGRMGPAS